MAFMDHCEIKHMNKKHQLMLTGRATPWPNHAETAVRLFKRQYEKLLADASRHLALSKVTLRDLVRECC